MDGLHFFMYILTVLESLDCLLMMHDRCYYEHIYIQHEHMFSIWASCLLKADLSMAVD